MEPEDKLEQVEKNKIILIDTTFLFDQYSFRGIGKYGKEVVRRIIKLALEDNFEVYFAGFNDLKQNLIALGLSQFSVDQYLNMIGFYSFGEPIDSSVGNLKRWKNTFKLAIEEIKPDIYYSVNFERGLPSSWILKRNLNFIPKTAVMAHDAIPIATNSYSSKSFLHNILKGLFYKTMFSGIRNADLVLTNSEYSKKDLIKYGKLKPEKIHSVYLGVDEKFFEKIASTDTQHIMKAFSVESKNYFIYDSGLEKNKGIFELIKIFKKIQEDNTNELPTDLVLVGRDFSKARGSKIKPKNERADKVLKELKKEDILENIVTTDRVSDEDLTILIKNAYCYFNFSKYEGFSFGPLQAMAAGVPAVVGNYSCIPEVTKGGAFLVDSMNTEKASKEIIGYLKDDNKKKELINKGREVVKKYDWDKTAEKTWEKIKSVI